MKLFKLYRESGAGDGGGGEGDSMSIKVFHGLEDKEGRDLSIEDVIPADYKEKEYLKGIDSFDKLFQAHDNAQKLIGSRPAGIPGEGASDEDWAKFHSTTAPKEAKDYTLFETEFGKKTGRDEAFGDQMKDLFKAADVTQRQADILVKGYDKVSEGLHAKVAEANTARDKEFDTKIDAMYPDNREAAMKTAKDLMSANIPDELKPSLEGLSNEAMLLIMTTMNSVHDKYIKEDGIGGGGAGGGADAAGMRTEAMKIMQSEAYKDFRNPGYDDAQNKVKELYANIAKVEDAKK